MDHPLGQFLLHNQPKGPWCHFYSKIVPDFMKLEAIISDQICVVSEGNLQICDYGQALKFSSFPTIDLVSGIATIDPESIRELTTLEFRILNNLARAGDYGVPLYMLIDLVYANELADPESMYVRMKQLIKRIRKSKIDIIRKENTFILQGKKTLIMHPKRDKPANICYYLSRTLEKFTVKEAAKKYGTSVDSLEKLFAVYLKAGNLISCDSKTFVWADPISLDSNAFY